MRVTALVLGLLALGGDVSTETTTLPTQEFTSSVDRTVNVFIPNLQSGVTCHLRTPDNRDLQLGTDSYPGVFDHSNFMFPCQVSMLVNREHQGEWVLYARSADEVVELPFVVRIDGVSDSESEAAAAEQPEPEDEFKSLDLLTYETPLNNVVQVRIARSGLATLIDSCQLHTPTGEVIDLYPGLEHPGLVVFEPTLMNACMVDMTISEEMNGEWTLYSREVNGNAKIEVEQPFLIDIEEPTSSFPADSVTIETGHDLYLRLQDDVAELVSCELLTPEAHQDNYRRDDRYPETCAFIVPGVTEHDSGTWQIKAKGRIGYKATLEVNVEEASESIELEKMSLTEGEAVEQDLGPENALYCQLRDPQGYVAFTGFQACKLEVPQVRKTHHGRWTMLVGLPGRLAPVEHSVDVEVVDSVTLNVVQHSVARSGDSLSLSCSMLTEHDVTTCKFIRPDSTIFLAQEGVGEGRYSYIGHGVRTTESGHKQVECGLYISSLQNEDLGSWRCLLEAEEQVSSSFLRVASAENAAEDLTAAEGSEVLYEELEVSSGAVTVLAGEEAVLLCSMPAYAQYCWFRAPNGSVFSLTPGEATADYEYYGSGLEAGECGLKIHSARSEDTGTWSCNVGTATTTDLSVNINVTVHESPMIVMHGTVRTGKASSLLVVVGMTYDSSPLDYCRFVTPTGFGFHFNSANMPSRYSFSGTNPSRGLCHLSVSDPQLADHGAWTIAGRLASGVEAIATTHPEYTPTESFNHLFWCVGLPATVLLFVVLMVLVLVNKRSRRWTSARVSSVGNSLRNIRRPRESLDKSSSGAPPAYDFTIVTGTPQIKAEQNS